MRQVFFLLHLIKGNELVQPPIKKAWHYNLRERMHQNGSNGVLLSHRIVDTK